ncbi:Transposase Tc1-like [Trinorchestia longiramus]|nr:Transposase Tc1-like [Trinorchestia longiramus]
MYRVLKEDLGKKLYQIIKRHELTEHHERMRAERSRHILNEMAQARSPDLNPLDFFTWSILNTRVLATPHTSFKSLKAKLHREWEAIPQEQIRATCDAFVNRLKAVVHNKKCRDTTLSKTDPRKIKDRAARKLVRTVVQRPRTTCKELKDDLKASGIEANKHTISKALRREGFRSRTRHRTPLPHKRHVKARLKYANDHLNKPAAFWNSVLWSDETKN